MQPILMTTFKQVLVFAEPPPVAVRRAMVAAGFKFNGNSWVATNGTTSAIGMATLDDILKAMTPEQGQGPAR